MYLLALLIYLVSDEMKRTAMKTSQAIHLPASVISTNRNKIIRIDPIKVEYYRIFIRRTESPLVFLIETRNPESLTICTSFSNPTPDIDDNNGVYSSGKVKIKVWLLILLEIILPL